MSVTMIWNKTRGYLSPISLIALIILSSWSFSRLPLITNRSKNRAIFYFWGERGLTDEEYNGSYSSFPLYIREDLERQCALDMHERTQLLSSLWNWDYYFYFQKLPDFNIINEYKTVLLVFSGHGKLMGSNQIFVFNQYSMRISQISEALLCNNITVVVESCYSVNWQANFTNKNTNEIFTSDLWNNSSYWEAIINGIGYDSNTYSFEYRAYDSVFLDCLLLGDSYSNANDTAIKQIINYFGVGLSLIL